MLVLSILVLYNQYVIFTLLSIAIEIADRYGLEVVYAVINNHSKNLIETERNSFVQGGRTDMQFLMFEVEKCGARMIVQNQKLVLIDSAIAASL